MEESTQPLLSAISSTRDVLTPEDPRLPATIQAPLHMNLWILKDPELPLLKVTKRHPHPPTH